MKKTRSSSARSWFIPAAAALAISLGGCGSDGSDGAPGPEGPAGPPGPPGPPETTALNLQITSVTVNSAPVVKFQASNQDGFGVATLTPGDLRFTVAKLTPGMLGDASTWQNYIVTVQNANPAGPEVLPSAVQGTRETPNAKTGEPGALENHGDGTYTYTFRTDITNVVCPAPCQDAEGKPLDLTFNQNLTHRVGIQTRGALPAANATFDFVPAGGALPLRRDIAKTESCNVCHDKLEAHDARVEVKYCVTCHNPGSTDPDTGNTVDFKVLIHKLHRGASLPSVAGGGKYAIWGFGGEHNFSDIHFPQDIRNCTKCHTNEVGNPLATPQGDNWKSVPTMQACGSCHDDIDFSLALGQPGAHSGGPQGDNTACATCHNPTGPFAVALKHTIPEKVARGKFKFNILEICGTAVGSNPVCAPGVQPVVKFSVTDPSNGSAPYDILNAPEFGAGASLNILTAWDTRDYNNAGGSGQRPARADSVNALSSAADAGGGTFTVTGTAIPLTAVGTGTIGMEGRPLAQDLTQPAPQPFDVRVPVNSEVAYFGITDAIPKPRRQVVDVVTKCDRCHDILSLHGSNRNNNGQLCVLCHNPNNTDVNRRPKTGGVPDPLLALDGKKEEAIDFKRLIHGIHAAAKSNFDGTLAHGFREKGLVIYGFGGGANDYSHIRFPGALWKCETCHLPGTYTLADRSAGGGGNWELPTQNGILGSTIDSAPFAVDAGTLTAGLADQVDDLNITPTAAVCSSCHDGAVAKAHMELNGALFAATQAMIDTNVEACAVCHGPGKQASVEFVHSEGFGEEIP